MEKAYRRLSITTGIIMIGFVVLNTLQLPTRSLTLYPFGTPLTFTLTGKTIITLLLLGLTGIGTMTTIRTHPSAQHISAIEHPLWIQPLLLTLTLVLFLSANPTYPITILAGAAGNFLLALLVLTFYRTLDPPIPPIVNLALELSAYLLLTLLIGFLYHTHMRSLTTSTATLFITFLLAFERLSHSAIPLPRRALYASGIGLILAQLMWAFNYSFLQAHSVALIFLIAFYTLLGTTRHHLAGTLTRQTLGEYLAIAAAGILLLSILR